MDKKVVVFGGNGFIGSYLVNELVERGYCVISASRNPSPHVDDSLFQQCDILDRDRVMELVKGAEVVYNCAGMANLNEAVKQPYRTFELNVLGQINILDACVAQGVKRYIYASSAYAMSDKGSFYGLSKLSAEKVLEEYSKKFDIAFTVLRYGSVYAARDTDNNYIYNVIKHAMLHNEIAHEGDGEEHREYIHAEDVARLSVDVIENHEYVNEYVLLTGTERMKRKELFDMINEILGGTLHITLHADGYNHHYKTTPYSFRTIRSKKLVANPFFDMGQGLVDCMEDIRRLNFCDMTGMKQADAGEQTNR